MDLHRDGESLSEPVYWEGRQWAVTAYGVECLDGTYPIDKEGLWMNQPEHSWEEHMSEKTWIDLPDFRVAIAIARDMYRHLKPAHLKRGVAER